MVASGNVVAYGIEEIKVLWEMNTPEIFLTRRDREQSERIQGRMDRVRAR